MRHDDHFEISCAGIIEHDNGLDWLEIAGVGRACDVYAKIWSAMSEIAANEWPSGMRPVYAHVSFANGVFAQPFLAVLLADNNGRCHFMKGTVVPM